ncbi:uncharacterized protein LOC130891391 [Diorhabda carinulata]|uniref:uncharacterized protein LOC130891391 n=1 Tax=Diorhabda carinulata TaxID=1163345 RepID=UPI0025A27A15|nr:uncharacterized protein LOC130891391 [Diorhabda carinulata]
MKIIVSIIFGVIVSANTNKLPNKITPCNTKDPNLSECVMSNINCLRSQLLDGIPQLNFPSLNPLKIDSFQITARKEFEGNFSNAVVYDVDKFNIKYLEVDLEKMCWSDQMEFDEVYVETDYILDGELVSMEFHEYSGYGSAKFFGIHANNIITLDTCTVDGEKYLKIKDISVDVHIDNYEMTLNGLEKYGICNEYASKMINAASHGLLQEFRDSINSDVRKIISDLYGRIFETVPLNELFAF